MASVDEIRAAVASGDMAAAAVLLDDHLQTVEDPELRMLRGQLAYLFADFDAGRRHLEHAVETFRSQGLPARAALAASWVARLFIDGVGNQVAGRAWLARARRLVADLEPCVEQGWVALATVGCSVPDATVLERDAAFALEIARRFGDADLEAKALADGGLALVSHGRITQGMEWVDEAMAMSSAERGVSPATRAQVVCCLFTACERAGDLGRTQAWVQVLGELGMFDPGRPAMGLAHCSGACGLLLTEVGRWTEAEEVLDRAVRVGSRAVYFARLGPITALADLRIRQGRLDEAEKLLLGHDDRVEALRPWARLHLARGDFDLAAAVARRGLRLLRGDVVRSAPLLATLVEAELGLGDVDGADAAAHELERTAAESEVLVLRVEASFARARVETARGRVDDAIDRLCACLGLIAGADLPVISSRVHLELARLQAGRDPAAAEAETRAAAAIQARFDLPVDGAEATLLRKLRMAELDASATPASTVVLQRDGTRWIAYDGATKGQLRDTKGVRYLAELVRHPHVERHVLDLVDAVEGAPSDAGFHRRDLRDAGELLDDAAKAAYRRRIEQLREEVEAALEAGDDDRAAVLDAEVAALAAELSRAVGLGGRDRRAGAVDERARLNVTRAVRSAIARVGDVLPDAASSLDRRIRTGLYCAYEPAADDEFVWTVGPLS